MIDELRIYRPTLPYRFPMPVEAAVELSPITSADIERVATFLHAHLNSRVSAAAWAAAMKPPWSDAWRNHGFLLQQHGKVVGAYLAFYSERMVDGRLERFCNLGAWCVLEGYRAHGLRLVRSLLGQRGYHFTDLSPSANVVAINKRLRFDSLDTTTAAVPNLPWPVLARGIRVSSTPDEVARTLTGRNSEIYKDHAHAAAARHVVISRGDDNCYVIWRHDRRKRLPLFGSVLYVSNPELYGQAARLFSRHLLLRHRVLVTLAERRVVGYRPPGSITLWRPRPKMFRSDWLKPDQIDYLYSELTCVAW
jgi:hypothetical protein